MSRIFAAGPRSIRLALASVIAVLALGAAVGCGGDYETANAGDESAAKLFNERCSGCHTLGAANSYGSKPQGQLQGGERTNGPNFNERKVAPRDALYAIRNGGFSGAIMPANIVVGRDAERLADFVSKYSGSERDSTEPGEGSGP